MGRISESSIQEVIAASDIVEIIGSYLPLKRAGTNYKALCPFHREKTPSFTVNPLRQTFRCFGCQAGGGVIGFVREFERIDFPSAVRKLAERAGIRLEEDASGEAPDLRRRLLALHAFAAQWFRDQLLASDQAEEARRYLKSRGIKREIATRWGLGFAQPSWDALFNEARRAKFSAEELEQSGLCSRREGSGDWYDRFRNRIIFPIYSESGDVIAFSGRALDPEDRAKYLNSPETPLFVKGRTLYGLHLTKRDLINSKSAVVCEGQLDLITAFEHGVRNVIAPQGTAFTEAQARVLQRLVEKVVLCFDSDAAGQKAAVSSLPALLSCNLEVRLALLPQGEDPDSTIRKQGAEAFRAIIDEAEDFFDASMRLAAPTLTTPRLKAAFGTKMGALARLISDPIQRESTLQKLAARLGVSMESLVQTVNRTSPMQSRDDSGSTESEAAPTIEFNHKEATLLQFALGDFPFRKWLRENNLQDGLEESPFLELLRGLLLRDLQEDSPSAIAAWIASLDSSAQRAIASLPDLPENPQATDVAKQWWFGLVAERLKQRLTEARRRLFESGGDLDQVRATQEEIVDLENKLSDIPRPSRWVSPG